MLKYVYMICTIIIISCTQKSKFDSVLNENEIIVDSEYSSSVGDGFDYYDSLEVLIMNSDINKNIGELYSDEELKKIAIDTTLNPNKRVVAMNVLRYRIDSDSLMEIIESCKEESTSVRTIFLGVEVDVKIVREMIRQINGIVGVSLNEDQVKRLGEINSQSYLSTSYCTDTTK